MELVDTQDLGSCAARCGGSSPPSRTTQSLQLQGLGDAAPICTHYSYNLLKIDSPVSKVSSPERCEYRSALAVDYRPPPILNSQAPAK